jgi:hypothetical protein
MKSMNRFIVFTLAALLFTAAEVRADSLCFVEAGALYDINPSILRAIAKVESNFNPKAVNRNRNGTYDFGVMQINSSWASTLGLERWSTLGDPCSNIKTGAMILANCMNKYGYTWAAIGCYNSQTPDKRDRYAQMVYRQLQTIEREDKEFKKKIETALHDRVNDLITANRNGQSGEIKLIIPEQSAPPEPQGVELSASSIFEGASKGL